MDEIPFSSQSVRCSCSMSCVRYAHKERARDMCMPAVYSFAYGLAREDRLLLSHLRAREKKVTPQKTPLPIWTRNRLKGKWRRGTQSAGRRTLRTSVLIS